MPPPQGRQAAARSGQWRRICCRPYKLSSDLTANQSGLVTLTFELFDLESGVRVTCDVGYLCANFSLPRPFCSRRRPDVRDRQIDVRQTSDVRQHHRLMPPPIRGGA